MKRSGFFLWFLSLIFFCMPATLEAFSQKGCQFNIVGIWKVAGINEASPRLYHFMQDGTIKMLSGEGAQQRPGLPEIIIGTYTLDDLKAPKVIQFRITKAIEGFVIGATSMAIKAYDETSFTCAKPDSGSIHWLKVDSHRYFIILAGRKGTFYDLSGPAFPMLIQIDSDKTQVDAVGIYSVRGTANFGTIPADTYREFMKDSGNPSDVMLRLEISAAQYDRGLQILRTWERRIREGTLLYPDISMDNILLAKQVTESLNQCTEKIKLYNLDWGVEDKISDNTKPTHIPFLYFQELRRLNQSLHVRDEQIPHSGHLMPKPMGQW
jgi:hypothetical protein